MGFLFALLICAGLVILLISINKDQNASSSSHILSNANSSSTSVSQVFSLEFSADLPDLSPELKLNLNKYVTLYRDALALYKIEQVKPASIKFGEASDVMEQIRSKYPNNLRINFDLLEAYQGCDWRQAIQQGFKCLEIVDKLLCQESLSQQKLVTLILCRCDVMRKLYKLLIKEDKIGDARSIVGEFLSTINSILENNPPPYHNHYKHIKMYGLCREGRIASFFLQGIREGRNVQRNLIVSPLTADDSPELGYYFDAKFSSADSEILSELRDFIF